MKGPSLLEHSLKMRLRERSDLCLQLLTALAECKKPTHALEMDPEAKHVTLSTGELRSLRLSLSDEELETIGAAMRLWDGEGGHDDLHHGHLRYHIKQTKTGAMTENSW